MCVKHNRRQMASTPLTSYITALLAVYYAGLLLANLPQLLSYGFQSIERWVCSTYSQLLLWSWKTVDNLIAKKLILPTFRNDINLFKKLKMTPEIRSPGHLMIPRAQTMLLPESWGCKRFSSPSSYWFEGLEAPLLCYSLKNMNDNSTPCKHWHPLPYVSL